MQGLYSLILSYVFFAQELAKKLQQSKLEEDKNIVVSIVNPGLVLTRAQIEDPNSEVPAARRALAREYPEGCKTHVFACVDPSAGKPGDAIYYTHCTTAETADITLGNEGDALRQRVWKDTLVVLGVSERDIQL